MDKGRLSVSPAAALLGALLYCTASFSELAAILAPVIVHELGHIVALRLYGMRVRRITADLRGLCIEYSGLCTPLGHAVSALAGPAAGLGYAFAASYYSRGGSNEVLTLSAGVSLLLSLFNLLPILPLDGGRIVAALIGEENALRVSQAAAVLLMLGGRLIFAALGAPGLLLAGAFLAASNFRRAAHL
jgi:stage IV sporulation protein FB